MIAGQTFLGSNNALYKYFGGNSNSGTVAPPKFRLPMVPGVSPTATGVKKPKHAGKAVLAGGIAGGIEICVTYPTEYVKTQLQLDERNVKPKFKGPMSVVKQTWEGFGFFGFYRGLSSLFYGSVPKAAIRFLAFEQFRGLLLDADGTISKTNTFIAGLGAGVTEAITIVCPMETIKVKFIHDQTQPKPRFKGFLDGVRQIVKQEGVGGVYKGLNATILKQGSNQAIRFVVFGMCTDFLKEKTGKDELAMWETASAGAVAGAASVFGNTPLDVVKTRMQGLDSAKYRSVLHCASEVLKTDGLTGFYKGVTPRLGRVTIDVALVMTLYTEIVKMLDKVWKTE